MLRHLAAEQRAAGAVRQPSATPATMLVDLLGHERADRDVVEEEQRLRALRRDVVDRHRDAVDADGVVRRSARRAMSDFVPTPSVDDTSSGSR